MGMAWVWGFAVVGTDAVPVRVEAHVRPGLPGTTIVGLPGTAVREARERVRSAAASSGVPLPAQRITVNLSPADVRKESAGLDLPVALAVLAASGYVPASRLSGIAAVGEVALDGLVRAVRGALPIAEAASRERLGTLIVPVAMLPEAAEVDAAGLVGVRSLREAVAACRDQRSREHLKDRGSRWLRRKRVPRETRHAGKGSPGPDLADIAGHESAKRALEIAAAGRHHLFLVGPPGSGKTMLARRLPTILPPLDRSEALEVTRIWSVAGLHPPDAGLVADPPFRAPHHTASRAALVGGGPVPRPGEVSLAHRGVLLLDELPEFGRDSLEALRQPLEEGVVTISRQGGTCLFPARCVLVGAMNPCPCGFLGHPTQSCSCSAEGRARYAQQMRGPLADRVDLFVEVPALTAGMLDGLCGPETSEAVLERVVSARAFRASRESSVGLRGRAHLGSAHPCALEDSADLTTEARRLLRTALARDMLGGRGFVRVVRVARTLADLDADQRVGAAHVAEALAFRMPPYLARS